MTFMSAKNYLRILRGGILLSLFFVLFLFSDLLFPYISSKQLPFNILMEVLLVIYLVFIWRYKSYRPKLNLITYGLIAYFLVILISAFSGVDFNLSFWGDVERMLGFFHIFHFLIFFFILITSFREWRHYRLLFQTSILVASIVSLIGLLGSPPHSTIGNTTYVSGYLIFNLFFAAILFFRSQVKWRYLYIIPVIIMLLEFKNMRTSGAIIGLAIGLFVSMVLIGFFHYKKKVKYLFLSLALVSLLVVGFIFSQQEATWFQNSFLKNLTGQKATFQTRLLSWESAWKDFGNHPLLGTGFGNYAIIFDRHFDPIFFNYDKNETYFDRAHNNLIDIASTTGVLGLLAYLSIFVFVFIYIVKLWRQNGKLINISEMKGRKNLELVLLVGLLLAYFIQNLAVFDSFVTYIGLMMTLGMIYWLFEEERYVNIDKTIVTSYLNSNRQIIAVLVIFVIVYLFTIQFNLKTWRMLEGTIIGYSQVTKGNIVKGFDTFEETLINSPMERDARASIINLVSSNPVILSTLEYEDSLEKFDYLEGLALKNLSYNEKDSLVLLQTSQLYDLGSRIFYENNDLKDKYSDKSLEYANRAVESSPGRIPVYFSKAQALLLQGNEDEAVNTLEYAKNLNLNYSDTYCRLAQVYLQVEDQEKALENIKICIDEGAVNKIGGVNSLISAASFLSELEDFDRAVVVLERLVQIYDSDPNMWMNLAKLYMLTEADVSKIRAAANQAVILDPSYISQAEELFED